MAGARKKGQEVESDGCRERAALLGAYELGRTLGEGNFGKVKHARRRATGEHFAVKILDRGRVLSLRGADDQVRREIAALTVLRHPNVVRLHEVTPHPINRARSCSAAKDSHFCSRLLRERKWTSTPAPRLFYSWRFSR